MSSKLIRPLVRQLHPYVPGEQPKIQGLVKLNTNENPYPPVPEVLRAIRQAVDERLRLYPNPTAQPVREKLAAFHGCKPEHIIVGNGSDELLAMAVRAFVEPETSSASDRSMVQFFEPSYSLYPVLARTHGAVINAVPLRKDFSIPAVPDLKREKKYRFQAALTFITTPNAPSGRGYSRQELQALCLATKGVVVLDEAYVDFAEENALALALQHSHVLVSRTFSKAYSLCFQRIGYFVGPPPLIEALDKIRDSYNVNGLAQVAAVATLEHHADYRKNFERVKGTREWLSKQLSSFGFKVFPSSANFILVQPPVFPAEQWLEKLRQKKILVRWFSSPQVREYLRITIGSQVEAEALLSAVERILPKR